jgi:glycosyltransferase involved in cell wall biosynthesis
MRIGIEAQRIFRKKKHGMDVVALELIKALQRTPHPHEVVIFVKPGEDECIKESPNTRIVKLGPAPYPIWEQLLLPMAASKERVDVLHCTSNTAPVFVPVPLVLTLHDIIYLEGVNYKKGTLYQKFGNLYRRLIVPLIVPRAKMILTVSNFENERIRTYFDLPKSMVNTAYNAAADHFARVQDGEQLQAVKKKYNLPDQYIFFLGNTDPKKNVKGVLKALSLLRQRGSLDLPLLMLDIDRKFLHKVAQEIGDPEVLDHIQLTGYVPNVDLPAIYSQARVFLYPSLRESFGIPILEGMICGVPVITSNTSAMPEVAGNAALLVDPLEPSAIANAIEELLHNSILVNDLVQKGFTRAKQFSWDANAKFTLSLYENFLKTFNFVHGK